MKLIVIRPKVAYNFFMLPLGSINKTVFTYRVSPTV